MGGSLARWLSHSVCAGRHLAKATFLEVQNFEEGVQVGLSPRPKPYLTVIVVSTAPSLTRPLASVTGSVPASLYSFTKSE